MRPIWQVLQDLNRAAPGELDCEECYAVLSYLADMAADGADEPLLLNAVEAHWRVCPQCASHHLKRIETEEKGIQNLPGN